MVEDLLDQIVYTDYGQLTLEWGDEIWDGDADRFFKDQQNGLVGAAVPGNVVIVLARRSGGSAVRIVLEASEPPASAEWEDVVEVSISLPAGRAVQWSTWAGESGGPLTVPPGQYWPATAALDAVPRVGSDNARYWHRTWGSRR
jgi:hypothetical protein